MSRDFLKDLLPWRLHQSLSRSPSLEEPTELGYIAARALRIPLKQLMRGISDEVYDGLNPVSAPGKAVWRWGMNPLHPDMSPGYLAVDLLAA